MCATDGNVNVIVGLSYGVATIGKIMCFVVEYEGRYIYLSVSAFISSRIVLCAP